MLTVCPDSLLDSGRTLAMHIYDLSMNVPGGDASAYASALVLIIALLLINVAAIHLMPSGRVEQSFRNEFGKATQFGRTRAWPRGARKQ